MTTPDSAPVPELTAAQRALLRLVCWVAMADGDFAAEERQLLQKLVVRTLPTQEGAAADAVHALAAEALEQPDLEALVADLGTADERQLAAKLAFQMACVNQRASDEAPINSAEKRAYRRLLELLDLPEAQVAEAEWAAQQELQQKRSLLELIGGALVGFGAWPTPEGGDGDLPPGYWL
jgi:uncharacterized tellurite resistance protein B-like protein